MSQYGFILSERINQPHGRSSFYRIINRSPNLDDRYQIIKCPQCRNGLIYNERSKIPKACMKCFGRGTHKILKIIATNTGTNQ
jgi:DNA-directed RNA polymerase subunit RPC12/RpoP